MPRRTGYRADNRDSYFCHPYSGQLFSKKLRRYYGPGSWKKEEIVRRSTNPFAAQTPYGKNIFGFFVYTLTVALAAAITAGATVPIARWDVVPRQCFSNNFKAGVIAFHEAGASVAFRVNGALKETVAQPSYNDQTGVVEYWTALSAADYPDGPITVVADVLPGGSGNTPRHLDTLKLYANSRGSLTNSTVKWVDCVSGDDGQNGTQNTPYKSIRKAYQTVGAGGTVYLKAGTTYDIAAGTGDFPTYQYWTTIRPAPGVTRDQVMVKPNRTDNGMMRYQGFSVRTTPDWGTVFYGGMSGNMLWADSLDISDINGKNGGGSISHYATITYVTDCYFHDFPGGPGTALVRNVTIRNILEDAVSGADLAVNILVDGIDPGTSGAHPDVYQLYAANDTINNKIVYNLRAYNVISQGLFNGGTPIEDIAFVNIVIDKDTSTVMYTQFDGYLNHVLFWHLTLDQQTFLWRDAINAHNTFVEDCVLQQMGGGSGGAVSGVTFSNNHFTDTSSYGAGIYGGAVSVGNPLFLNRGQHDYHLANGSPAKGTGKTLACVPADIDGNAFGASPNKGAYSSTAAPVIRREMTSRRFIGPFQRPEDQRIYSFSGRRLCRLAVYAEGVYVISAGTARAGLPGELKLNVK
jgi:hypothetical protein